MPAYFLKSSNYFYKIAATIGRAVFIVLLLVSVASGQVKFEPIVLSAKTLTFVPKEFYVATLIDERTEKSAVAWVYPVSANHTKIKLQTVDLQGGGFNAIQNFVLHSFPQNKKSRPIVLHLQECRIVESFGNLGMIKGNFKLSLSFDLMQDHNLIHLSDYQLETKYSRLQNQPVLYETMLWQGLVSALGYLNVWMEKESNSNPILAKSVQVRFHNYHDKLEGDTIYYANDRPLTWKDFQDKPGNGKFAAMVFPSFGFDEHKTVEKSVLYVNLDIKIYLPKSACWVKDGYKDAYTLNHEQRHFDLVAIVGKQFEQKIQSMKLPVANCDGLINVQFYESFREMDRLQKQYDDETAHGLNTSAQENWNKRIDRELTELGIKPKPTT